MSVFAHSRETNRIEPAFRVRPDRPLALLKKCPVHGVTPMLTLAGLADELGVGWIVAKDESARMRLGSFKALGGAYAVAQMICDAAGVDDPTKSPDIAAGMVFVTASAGNHGLSVAAGARIFGAKAVIVLPATAPEAFAERIRAAGAQVIAGGSYDESVADAIRLAEENAWIHLSDGSWPGYIGPPALVMEGYSVLAEECRAHFEERGEWPTHVFIQAGVGGIAGAVAAHVREKWAVQPQVVVVEPDRAPCLQNSAKAGKLVPGSGPVSNMGRLDCKNASMIAFEALRHDADVFMTISDEAAAQAVTILERHDIATTPSGAAGLAGLIALEPGADSRSMIVVSEGPEHG